MWINNGEEIIQFPHVPPDFPLSQNLQQNETYSGLLRDYTMISKKQTQREYEWSSFWDNQDSKTMRSWFKHETLPYNTKGILNGWEFVEILKLWRWRCVPVRMFLFNESSGSIVINLAVTIENFDVKISKIGQYDYKIKVKEYNFVSIGNENADFSLISKYKKEIPQPVDDEEELKAEWSDGMYYGKDLGSGLIWNGFFKVINNPGITPTPESMKSAYAAGFIWDGVAWHDFLDGCAFYTNSGEAWAWDKKSNAFSRIEAGSI